MVGALTEYLECAYLALDRQHRLFDETSGLTDALV